MKLLELIKGPENVVIDPNHSWENAEGVGDVFPHTGLKKETTCRFCLFGALLKISNADIPENPYDHAEDPPGWEDIKDELIKRGYDDGEFHELCTEFTEKEGYDGFVRLAQKLEL